MTKINLESEKMPYGKFFPQSCSHGEFCKKGSYALENSISQCAAICSE